VANASARKEERGARKGDISACRSRAEGLRPEPVARTWVRIEMDVEGGPGGGCRASATCFWVGERAISAVRA
jgi:hypothetical protein